MPAKSPEQASTARAAGALKKGELPASHAGPAVKSMAKMPMSKLKHFMKMRECLSSEGKKKMLKLLHYFKQLAKEEYTGNVGGETDITNADNLMVSEEIPTTERNVVAKTFDTKADFDSYVNQHRGIEMTPKEQQAILGYKNAKPTQQDRFFVKYENTDDFGNNDTTVIKKLKEGNQFCWTAFSKHESAEEEGKPEGAEEAELTEEKKFLSLDKIPIDSKWMAADGSNHGYTVVGKDLNTKDVIVKDLNGKMWKIDWEKLQWRYYPVDPTLKEQNASEDEITVNDPIRITKTITFINDVEGANVLGDFLRKLDI